MDQSMGRSAIAVQTTNTKEVQGIFFTVQVGVYINTLVPNQLKAFRELEGFSPKLDEEAAALIIKDSFAFDGQISNTLFQQ